MRLFADLFTCAALPFAGPYLSLETANTAEIVKGFSMIIPKV
jgi:hypothetical protein